MRDSCPFCASSSARAGPVRGDVEYRICRRCGSGYVAEPGLAFRDYYERYDPELVRDLPEILSRRYSAVLEDLARRAPGLRLLEVGCGNGHFLEVARDRGWAVRGVELSRAHVERARARGLAVEYGDLNDDRLWNDETFDVVVLIEVLEHVPEPRSLLEAISERLERGGVTYLTTPNFGSISRRLLGGGWSVLDAEHVALASPRGLRLALAAAGQRAAVLRSKNLYLGEYRRLLGRGSGGGGRDAGIERAEEAARLRDTIEASDTLRAAKTAANRVLAVTGLGESLECVAVEDGGVR